MDDLELYLYYIDIGYDLAPSTINILNMKYLHSKVNLNAKTKTTMPIIEIYEYYYNNIDVLFGHLGYKELCITSVKKCLECLECLKVPAIHEDKQYLLILLQNFLDKLIVFVKSLHNFEKHVNSQKIIHLLFTKELAKLQLELDKVRYAPSCGPEYAALIKEEYPNVNVWQVFKIFYSNLKNN